MASGKSAEKIYELIEELGGQSSDLVLTDLIKFLSSDTLVSFEEYFRRNHDMINYESQVFLDVNDSDTTEDFEENSFEICIEPVGVDEETSPPHGSNKFFSSLIPEC